jgi:hypothetical protein
MNRTNGNTHKTHCRHGHEFTPANIYLWRGHRECRTCKAINRAASKSRPPAPAPDPLGLLYKANKRIPMSAVETAAMCGVTKQRVLELERSAIRKLAEGLVELDPEVFGWNRSK